MSSPLRRHRRGFTLLEVLVAIAILGLGLTVILSAQTGLFASSQHASSLSVATGLSRCKMSELEEKFLVEGYPLLDAADEGPCCEDQDYPGFTCAWKIDRVELPEAQPVEDLFGEEGSDDESMLGPLGALSQIEKTEGAILGENNDIGGMAELMGGSAGALAPMVMAIVYPDLKLMLEASIRKVTVSVKWREGSREQDFSVVQFVANPTLGGFDPLAAEGVTEALEQAAGVPTIPTPKGGGR